MKKQVSNPVTIQHQFDSFVKKVLAGEVKSYRAEMARQSAKEALLPPSFQPLDLCAQKARSPPASSTVDNLALCAAVSQRRRPAMPDTVVPDSRPAPPTSTRRRTARWLSPGAAQVLNGTRYYGGAAGHAVPLPDSVVQIAADPGTDCPTWRIDANAAVPQPDGHGKRFPGPGHIRPRLRA